MRFGVVYLGVGGAAPAWGRGLPSLAVVHEGDVYLFDVGEGTQGRLVEAGLSVLKVKVVAVTHLHGDHFFGLPGLLQFMTLSGRRDRLVVIGPRALLDYILEAERVTGHRRSFDIEFRAVSPGVVYREDEFEIAAFPVCHSGVESYGYVVKLAASYSVDAERLRRLGLRPGPYLSRLKRGETVVVAGRRLEPRDVLVLKRPELRIVYTGDTRPCDTVVEASRGATLLVHDATFSESEAEEARAKGHSTALEAARVASNAGVEWLALIHYSARYRDTSILTSEASRVHPRVYAPEPYMVHALLP